MTTSAPARPPESIEAPADQVGPSSLHEEALIEEARQRARRRRRRYGLTILLLVAVAGGLTAVLLARDGGANDALTNAPVRSAAGSTLPRNGPLTIVTGKPGDSSGGGLYEVGKNGLEDSVFRCGVDTPCWELEGVGWAPDGKRLAYGAESIGGDPVVNGLYVLDVTAGTSRQIVKWNDTSERGGWYEPAWSPDGNTIAYVSATAGCCEGHAEIFMIKPDGSHKTTLETGTASSAWPSWSPDGTRIAFATVPSGAPDHSRSVNGSIYAIDTDGTHRTLIARHGTAPSWSPDGTRIAYLTGCGQPPFRSIRSNGIRIVTPAGRAVSPSASAGCATVGVAGAPAWSPDGTKIAIANSGGVYVMNANGTHLRRLTASRPFSVASNKRAWARPAWQPLPRTRR